MTAPVRDATDETLPTLSISPETVCFIALKARQFNAKDILTDPDDPSNPTDDAMVEVLEDHADDPVVRELVAAISVLSVDEKIDLVTLTCLLGIPVLSDYLQEGLALLGRSCAEFEKNHL